MTAQRDERPRPRRPRRLPRPRPGQVVWWVAGTVLVAVVVAFALLT